MAWQQKSAARVRHSSRGWPQQHGKPPTDLATLTAICVLTWGLPSWVRAAAKGSSIHAPAGSKTGRQSASIPSLKLSAGLLAFGLPRKHSHFRLGKTTILELCLTWNGHVCTYPLPSFRHAERASVRRRKRRQAMDARGVSVRGNCHGNVVEFSAEP
ncbi:hypothetical protein OH77DRAFT_1256799 [Trametes cingulata]|nr:hypothetical protein OH77DRAFT_1256799 [Trametes cingulata]